MSLLKKKEKKQELFSKQMAAAFARLNIREINNDTIVFNDGTFASVLALKIPEFIKLSKTEQMKTIAGFRLWLDSLNHPVQICARTVNAGMKDRLMVFRANTEASLKKRKEYKNAMMDFARFYKWFEEYAEKNASQRRLYYVVIPYLPYFRNRKELKKMKRMEEFLEKLNQRTNSSISLLKGARIDAKRLSTNELVNLYSSFLLFSFYNKEGSYDTIEDCIKKWNVEGE